MGSPPPAWMAARFDPYSVSNSPGAMPAVNGASLPEFTTPVGFKYTPVPAGVGACSETLSPRYHRFRS
jgi:hypothetical protein